MNHPRIHAETEKFIIYRFEYIKLTEATAPRRQELFSASNLRGPKFTIRQKNECKVYEEHLTEIAIIPHYKQSKSAKSYAKHEFA